MLEKIHIIITLVAALIITIVAIVNNISVFVLSVTLIVTIIVFFVLGLFLKATLLNVFSNDDTVDNEFVDGEDDLAVDLDDNLDSDDMIDNFDDES